jgi:hypothetical protein
MMSGNLRIKEIRASFDEKAVDATMDSIIN